MLKRRQSSPRTTPDSEVSERVPADAIASWVVVSPGLRAGREASCRPDGVVGAGRLGPSRLSSRALEQQRRRAADDVAEHALGRGGVLVGVHPAPLLVVGDQPASQAIDPRFVGACAARATPAIAQRGPARAYGAQILRREAPPATAARARRSMGLRRDDPRLGHHCAMIRTRVPLSGVDRAPLGHRAVPWARAPAIGSPPECTLATGVSGLCRRGRHGSGDRTDRSCASA